LFGNDGTGIAEVSGTQAIGQPMTSGCGDPARLRERSAPVIGFRAVALPLFTISLGQRETEAGFRVILEAKHASRSSWRCCFDRTCDVGGACRRD